MTTPGDDATAGQARRRAAVVLAVMVVVLAAAVVLRSAWIADSAHFAFNVGLAAAVLGVAAGSGLSRAELGLDARDLGAGVRWGGAAFAVVAVVTVSAALVASSSGVFDVDGVEVTAAALLWRVLVVIPLGTVVLEELVFRGVLLALLGRITTTAVAIVVASVSFGLWHVPGAWSGPSAGGLLGAETAGVRLAPVAITVVATTLAGFVFCWLRLRSRSLVAPTLAHLATNTVPLAVAWILHRVS